MNIDMEVTVKTLDSQTRTFNVSLETTVKEFKTKIAEEMKIPIEKQRLIFQGKVLSDEKQLQDYKVSGCVVHLVERQPPRTRSNGQSTETTTGSTSTTSMPGNIAGIMGAFALPVDVMGVTQQIVQGIVQQIGAESAQANISTTSSDDGSSVNVHVNLSTSRNDCQSRIAPARAHLNNVSRIIQRLENDGLPSSNYINETNSNAENGVPSNSENSLEDLANILQQVVQLNDEMRPHLIRYQELLRSHTDRQLQGADDLLPDLTAEVMHSLSHAFHALSDITTNFRVPDPQLNVLPAMSPVPFYVGNARNTASSSQSQSNGPANIQTGIPIGLSLRPGNSGLGMRMLRTPRPGFGLRPGSMFRPGPMFRPANGMGVGFANPAPMTSSTSAPLTSSTPVPLTSSTSVPVTSSTPLPSSTTSRPVSNAATNPQVNSLIGAPVNLQNLPNFAIQINPASGNITIAHIVTSIVEEPSLRATTVTTNSTPSPRTSSRGSQPIPLLNTIPLGDFGAVSAQNVRFSSQTSSQNTGSGLAFVTDSQQNVPLDATNQPTTEGITSVNHTPSNTANSTPSNNVNPPHNNSHAAADAQRNSVLNFLPNNVDHRDPLLPCQSFHFASLVPRSGQAAPVASQRSEQASQNTNQNTPHATSGPVIDFSDLIVNDQRRNTERQTTENAGNDENMRNPFVLMQQPVTAEPTHSFMFHVAETLDERQQFRSSSEDEDVTNRATLSRYLQRLFATIPMTQLLMTVMSGSGDPIAMSRSMTREFLRNDILGSAEPTPENLQRATEKILDETKEILESFFASCNVKENIDAPSTLLSYLRPKIRRLLELVNSTEPDSVYTSDMSALLSRMAAELFVLTEYCLEDGRTGLQTAMTRYLVSSQTLSSLPDPSMQAMIMQTMWTSMQDFRNDISVRETSLMPFVIRKEKRKSHAKKTDSPTMERNARTSMTSSSSSSTSFHDASNKPHSSGRTNHSAEAECVSMETDENWKRVIPAEWVPVISEDIIRQQRVPHQSPFSDAYLNGMPPKRRKLYQTNEPAPYNQCVSATLKRSITKSGVTPRIDVDKVSKEANSSQSLERVFEDEVRSEVRKRLASDTDYNSEKFPAIHKYFGKNEKR
ncbi:large proline-rich protein BAG6-like isoform X2 [Xenia sp. Carnegie-2017]|uniref:large proline-rich protein BAG6-like isoform X2 n=1 Tax=Xenia sp. Carnegie-2017 TaxID=2897299 RepID=UPI001F046941|nr:large proline-rich protein BAG6-like isoform X2 [Xenia sp. Carnegie-2017]